MRGSAAWIAVEPLRQDRADLVGALDEPVVLEDVDRGERGGARDRVAAVGAAEAAGVRGVHDLGPAGDGRERQPAGDALGGRDQVGHDAEELAGEHRAGAGEAGLHLVGDEDDVVRAAPVDERAAGSRRRGR